MYVFLCSRYYYYYYYYDDDWAALQELKGHAFWHWYLYIFVGLIVSVESRTVF